jgi:hypothetical protein
LPHGSASLSTDGIQIRRGGRELVCSWLGPVTDRARLEVATFDASAYPCTVRLVLGSAWGDPSEEWDHATAGYLYASAQDASGYRPVMVVGGIPTRRWSLYAWLDGASASDVATFRAELIVDRGATGAPFVARATGVVP